MFELSKWYGDCISQCGDLRIAYSARVRYGHLKVAYSSLLDGEAASHSLRRARIEDEGQTLSWAAPGLSANWTRQDAELRATVFESAEGAVEWRCAIPKGGASMNEISGLGYAEHVRMTIAPWKLPIRTLRWGRFLTPHTTLIWIDWQGPFTTRLVFLNGQRVLAETLDDGGTRAHCRACARMLSMLWGTLCGAPPGMTARIAPKPWASRAKLSTAPAPAMRGLISTPFHTS